ncbi:hypothetical protein VNO78_04569 [Psophocarpus tetragonolobus]|uniref:Pectinesterase inhibitor domain-containing protein n=1 Tax=Psophocarpus tetragonolobus TaxID=3891 RepID=A0AAN9T203_PSOTE
MGRIQTCVSYFAIHIIIVACICVIPLTQSQASFSQKSGNSDFGEEICKNTPFYDLCSSILHANPQSQNSDPKGVALLMVNSILANASDTLSFIEGLIKQTSDRDLEQALAFCAESYIPIVKYTLPQAAQAISQARFGFAGYCISDALKQVISCDNKFSRAIQTPLGGRNDFVQKLVSVASAIIKLLLKS